MRSKTRSRLSWGHMATAATACLALCLSACGVETVTAEAESPDGRYVAAAILRNDAGGFVTMVDIRQAGTEYSGGRRDWVLAVLGERKVQVTWQGPRELTVALEEEVDLPENRSWRDVFVRYERIDDD